MMDDDLKEALTSLEGVEGADKARAVLEKISAEYAGQTWVNAFGCIRPTDEFAAELGRSVIRACRVPGQSIMRFSLT